MLPHNIFRERKKVLLKTTQNGKMKMSPGTPSTAAKARLKKTDQRLTIEEMMKENTVKDIKTMTRTVKKMISELDKTITLDYMGDEENTIDFLTELSASAGTAMAINSNILTGAKVLAESAVLMSLYSGCTNHELFPRHEEKRGKKTEKVNPKAHVTLAVCRLIRK